MVRAPNQGEILLVLICSLVLSLPLWTAGSELSSDGLSLRFYGDKDHYITYDRLRLYLEVSSASLGDNIDVYLAIMMPDESLLGLLPDLSFSGLNVERGFLYPVSLEHLERMEPAMADLAVGPGVRKKTVTSQQYEALKQDLEQKERALAELAVEVAILRKKTNGGSWER